MKAGTYFIGDPCLILNESWDDFLLKTDMEQISEFKGEELFYGSTAWGDGDFKDGNGVEYKVESGTIGIFPMNLVEIEELLEMGNIVTFNDDFDVSNDNGLFTFGDVVINTDSDEYVEEVEEDIEWLWNEEDDNYGDHQDMGSYYDYND